MCTRINNPVHLNQTLLQNKRKEITPLHSMQQTFFYHTRTQQAVRARPICLTLHFAASSYALASTYLRKSRNLKISTPKHPHLSKYLPIYEFPDYSSSACPTTNQPNSISTSLRVRSPTHTSIPTSPAPAPPYSRTCTCTCT